MPEMPEMTELEYELAKHKSEMKTTNNMVEKQDKLTVLVICVGLLCLTGVLGSCQVLIMRCNAQKAEVQKACLEAGNDPLHCNELELGGE